MDSTSLKSLKIHETVTATQNRKGNPVAKRAPADWERENSHWLKDLTNWHADPEILLEYIKEGVTEESNYSEFKIQLEVSRENEIVCHNTTHVERFSEETGPRKIIHRIEGAVLNSKPSPRSWEETKNIVKEATDTLFPYRDYEMGNYRQMLDSMNDHQSATAITHKELLHSFLENETLREEEDRKRQTEKAKSMEGRPVTHRPTGSTPKIPAQCEYLATERNIPIEEQKQWSKQLSVPESAAFENREPSKRPHCGRGPNFEIGGLLKLAEIHRGKPLQ
ncbi:hypothetical protein F25303_14059 [Fusarium sp. NRRL 25303]|nr:hypothetical protein F25303_14059 [Fusarium sp. NRRL 25303]